ncbi:MAG: hypothetical protein ONB44_21280 [candidate division KSB1 bacterium]|nr:hypothetical protein [candidate division KSB1 bacterium]MDZ7304668.1 hypothetical protein [candidate division KSB1 bacterium]MDZ7313800.1 hypothetical protein [candidate division KSB1 bacterium]
MKRVFILVMVLALVLMASQTWAQARKSQIELFGGVAIPLAPDAFKDYFKVGGSLHGQYVIFPSPTLGISFGVAVEGFTFDGDKLLQDLGFSGSGVTVEGSASVVELGVGLRPYLTQPEANTQFFLFGMGTYNLLSTESKVSGFGESYSSKDDTNKFGVAAGAGFELPAGEKINIIIQGLTRFIFTENETTSFVGITGGVVF